MPDPQSQVSKPWPLPATTLSRITASALISWKIPARELSRTMLWTYVVSWASMSVHSPGPSLSCTWFRRTTRWEVTAHLPPPASQPGSKPAVLLKAISLRSTYVESPVPPTPSCPLLSTVLSVMRTCPDEVMPAPWLTRTMLWVISHPGVLVSMAPTAVGSRCPPSRESGAQERLRAPRRSRDEAPDQALRLLLV